MFHSLVFDTRIFVGMIFFKCVYKIYLSLFEFLFDYPLQGYVLRAGVIYRPSHLVSMKFFSDPVLVVVTQNGHKAAAFLHAPLRFWATKLSASSVPGL